MDSLELPGGGALRPPLLALDDIQRRDLETGFQRIMATAHH